MKYLLTPVLLFVLMVFLTSSNFEQTSNNKSDINKNKDPLTTYSEVKVNIHSKEDIKLLQQNDITVEHYDGNIIKGITLVINQAELQRLKNLKKLWLD